MMIVQERSPRIVMRDHAEPDSSRMTITVVRGVGQGQTLLSAFDAALWRAGAHNYNLMPLSSVIPPGSRVVTSDRREVRMAEFGHRLYVVKAEARADEPGTVIGAGLGWLQWGDGRGVFVEHELSQPHGSCAEVELRLKDEITSSLRDLAHVRCVEFDPDQVGTEVAATRVESRPACALVMAVYQAEGWGHGNAGDAGTAAEEPPIWSSSDLPYACLKDTQRTLALREAIRRGVRPGDVVVDVGAGTGILAFFAAEAGAAKVYAVELDPLLATALRRSAALNELVDRVEVVSGDARTVHLPRDADVVIAELIETGLIEEQQVAVLNNLHRRGVIGPRTRLIPERYRTAIELVEVETTFYGFAIAAPLHEWPNYVAAEDGWLPVQVRPLTAKTTAACVDFGAPVPPAVDRHLALTGIADGVANAIRISGQVQLCPQCTLGPTNALNGDKILRLPEPVPVRAGEPLNGRVSYSMGGGLGGFSWRQEA
jgi:arginine decarboxylase